MRHRHRHLPDVAAACHVEEGAEHPHAISHIAVCHLPMSGKREERGKRKENTHKGYEGGGL